MRENLEHAQERQRKFEERLWQEQQNRVPEVSDLYTHRIGDGLHDVYLVCILLHVTRLAS